MIELSNLFQVIGLADHSSSHFSSHVMPHMITSSSSHSFNFEAKPNLEINYVY
jgi:hypothetical protein